MSHDLIVLLILGAFAALAGLVLFFARRGRQTANISGIGLADVRGSLQTLLRRGYDLGFVVFDVTGNERFVEFSKYMQDSSHIGLTLDFPKASWSEPSYDQVKSLLESRKIPYVVEDTPDGPVKEFIQVDIGQNLDLGADLTREIFVGIFQVSPDVRLNAEFGHVNPIAGQVEI